MTIQASNEKPLKTLPARKKFLNMVASPIGLMHLACLGILFTGFSWVALLACLITYVLRVFSLTAGFHRLFAHRTFRTGRVFQFVLAWLGTSAAQLGPLWWAGNHRQHHQHADTGEDLHSPVAQGPFWAHIGWVLRRSFRPVQADRVKDLICYPELRFVDRFHLLPVFSLAGLMYLLGHLLQKSYPEMGTSGLQLLMWGFFLSTVLVYHVTFSVNSLGHMVGRRRFETRDNSRNNALVALFTFGEGWHNNHHRWPASARQGMYWWELDLTYLFLRLLEKARVVRDLRVYPDTVYAEAQALKSKRQWRNG